MAQPRIVLAELDSGYLTTLERLFLREYRHSAEIVIFSDEQALNQYFAKPMTVDILVINEQLYNPTYVKHNIKHLFILTEDEPASGTTGELAGRKICKYTSGKSIIESVVNHSGISHATNLHTEVAKVLMVYSPAGGMGQTTVAAGLCALFERNFRRVLFIGTDDLQTFGFILKNGDRLQPDTAKSMLQKSKYLYEIVKPMIAGELFNVLPPFPSSLSSLGIHQEHWAFLTDLIKNSGDYDYIVIDGGAGFNDSTTTLMSYADQVLLVAGQDENSVYKLHCLMDNIDCSDSNRFSIVCNKFDNSAPNHLAAGTGRRYPRIGYIEWDAGISPKDGDYLANLQSMARISQFYV